MRKHWPTETRGKIGFLELEQRNFLSFTLIKNKITEIKNKLQLIKDESFVKPIELLIGKKLFQFGLLKHPASFRSEKIGIKNFLDRQLIKIILKKNQKLSFKKAIDIIEKGKVSIKTNILFNPAYMLRRSQEKNLEIPY